MVEAPPGPALVLAGAGSGKTRVLAYRLAHLTAQGVPPERILLCTFTNRAARELGARVEALTGLSTRSMWAGTFHHIAHLLLRRHGSRLGLPERFRLLDRADAEELFAGCLAETGASRLPAPRLGQSLLSLALAGQRPLAEVLAARAPRFMEAAPALERAANRFAARKAAAGALDFDDLLFYAKLLLLECADVAREVRGRIAHVLVDEYQDASRLQSELCELVAAEHRSLMVVGDDAQSIYGFRGAELGNLLEFGARWPDARRFVLGSNYRSTPEIVALAERAIQHNRARLEKPMRARRPAGSRPALVALDDPAAEARFVAARVGELVAGGRYRLADCAVLYRSHGHSLELELTLTRQRIAYQVRAGARFFEQAHVRDVAAHLRLSVDGADPLAWRRVLRQQHGIGPRSAERVIAQAAVRGLEALTDLGLARELPAPARAALGRLAALYADTRAPAALVTRIVEEHYAAYAARMFEDAPARLDDLRALGRLAARFETADALLADLALGGAAREPDGADALTLSTIHQAKGLEWPVVFIVGLAEGRFPLAGAFTRPEELEEERRLFYVAVTRARDELHLCHPDYPSRFVLELAAPGGARPYDPWTVRAR